ncbi:MAG: DUF2442 domain-containing protein [Longimicrobiales bacterium]
MIRLVEARARSGHQVWLRYDDGAQGVVDLSDLGGRGVFQVWSDRLIFEALRVTDRGALEWPGGLDLCGDALYLRLTGKSADEVFPRLRALGVHA